MRKKLSDMTPIERTNKLMAGLSWDEAEDAGVEILARCSALHIYSRKEGSEYLEHLLRRIALRADEWAHEPGVPGILAIAAMGHRLEQQEKDINKNL